MLAFIDIVLSNCDSSDVKKVPVEWGGISYELISSIYWYDKKICTLENCLMDETAILITRLMGPTWRPLGACRPQVGPILAPWSLLSEFPLVLCTCNHWHSNAHNRNTAWLRDTVRQTSRGKSAANGRLTTQYSFYPVQIYRWYNNSEALKLQIQWFTKEWLTHARMMSPAKPSTR